MSSVHIPLFLRKLVIKRAGNRCEYCRLSQLGQEATFHVDHVKPIIAGGETVADNLALACVSCSLKKGARLSVIDPTTGKSSKIFDPRKDVWTKHFEWAELRIKGLTPIGRATVDLLKMNRTLIIAIRREEYFLGRLYE